MLRQLMLFVVVAMNTGTLAGNNSFTQHSLSLSITEDEQTSLAAEVKRMFYHAYDNYMIHAFPQGNLRPISCNGSDFQSGELPMITLIDNLDTLVIMGDAPGFRRAVMLVASLTDFDLDINVSVFEITIRVLGGLLAAHRFAIDHELGLYEGTEENYRDELLHLAIDLTDRLVPAFATRTGIPYGTVNLHSGVSTSETNESSVAGAGSLSLEWTVLSHLTGNATYGILGQTAVKALYQRRSTLGLLGKHINIQTGSWTESTSGIGSNSDSFYEYALKMSLLFHDELSFHIFTSVYESVKTHNQHGDWYIDINMYNGCSKSKVKAFENLMAFWPGLQTLVGDLEPAAASLNAMYALWTTLDFIPERMDIASKKILSDGYPLRPELIESTYLIYQATGDRSWLVAGRKFLTSLQTFCKTSCGYASIGKVVTKQLDDDMPSFFLSETCKYLYLLFDRDNFIHANHYNAKSNTNTNVLTSSRSYIFSTEAHPFSIPSVINSELLPSSLEMKNTADSLTCPVHYFYHALGYKPSYRSTLSEPKPRCTTPLAPTKPTPPMLEKTHQHTLRSTNFIVTRYDRGFKIRYKDTGSWIRVSNVNTKDDWILIEYGISNGSLALPPSTSTTSQQNQLYHKTEAEAYTCVVSSSAGTSVRCAPSQFGPDTWELSPTFIHVPKAANAQGCVAIDKMEKKLLGSQPFLLLFDRGNCSFQDKVIVAEAAGANGVIVRNMVPQSLMLMEGVDDEIITTLPTLMVPAGSHFDTNEHYSIVLRPTASESVQSLNLDPPPPYVGSPNSLPSQLVVMSLEEWGINIDTRDMMSEEDDYSLSVFELADQ